MRESERKLTGLLHPTKELRQLILDHPDLPLLVFAGDEANNGEYSYMACSSVSATLGEFLDCLQDVDDEHCFTDRDDFQSTLENQHSDFDGSEREFKEFIENLLMEYEPYWKPCIIVYVDN